jgi:hypothetical protein
MRYVKAFGGSELLVEVYAFSYLYLLISLERPEITGAKFKPLALFVGLRLAVSNVYFLIIYRLLIAACVSL